MEEERQRKVSSGGGDLGSSRPAPPPEAGGDIAMGSAPAEANPIVPAPAKKEKKEEKKIIRRHEVGAPALQGDRKSLIAGYKENSLCNTLLGDAIERCYQAMEILDEQHADIIMARLKKAALKSGSAKRAGFRDIPFKKAVSIALQAEAYVYQAQAAAAKSMAKGVKRCRHNIAGRRKLTKEEKDARYLKTYGIARGTKSERAERNRLAAKAKRVKTA